jgi:hypothetical protein
VIELDQRTSDGDSRDDQNAQIKEASMSFGVLLIVVILVVFGAASSARAAENPPLTLARDGFFYVGGKPTVVNGKQYMAGQMYVEYRIPARKTHPYPIIMVHGGTMSGTNYTGTPDGREGWAQYFVR